MNFSNFKNYLEIFCFGSGYNCQTINKVGLISKSGLKIILAFLETVCEVKLTKATDDERQPTILQQRNFIKRRRDDVSKIVACNIVIINFNN